MDRSALRRLFAPLLCGAGLVVWSVPGQAQIWPATDGGAIVRHAVTGGFVEVGGPFSTWPAAADGAGGAVLKGSQAVKLPGAKLEVQLARALTVGSLARGAMLAARLAGPVALVGLAYEGVRFVAGEWEKDAPDAPPVPGRFWKQATNYGACTNNGGFACSYGDALAAYVQSRCVADPRHTQCQIVGAPVLNSGDPNSPSSTLFYQVAVKSFFTQNGTWYDPGPVLGAISAGPETAGAPESPSVPATDDDLVISFQQGLVANPNKAVDVAKSVVDQGLASQLVMGDTQASGPSSLQGPQQTTTTMTDAGTRTDQRSTIYNVTYSTNIVNVTETTTTTTTLPDNSVQTTTTTTTAPGSGGDGAAVDDKPDVCVDHPDASGCEPLGEPEDDFELPTEDRNVDLQSELSAAGSCPAPKALSILGRSYSLEWTPLCDLATGVRPVVLALSWLSAGAFVFMIGRGATA